jgi:hypothetical protein
MFAQEAYASDRPYGIMKKIHLLSFCFLFWAAFYATGPANASNEITRVWNGNIIIEAHDSALVEIFKELYDKYSIEVSGLESRESDKITFSFEADTLEALLRGLLRYLGVNNFAIQFADATLTRIVVVPDSMSDMTTTENVQMDQKDQLEPLSVAQIQSIVEFSQAESLDLIAGDIIIEYDGVRITNAQQLVEEVEKKSEKSQVEMIVIREKNPVWLILTGGIIGVRIMTKKISKEEINSIFYLN